MSQNKVPKSWVSRRKIPGETVARLINFARTEGIVKQCLDIITSRATTGGFSIEYEGGRVPLFFRDHPSIQYMRTVFDQMLVWLYTVGFVPIAIESDVTRWASDNKIIEKLTQEIQKEATDPDTESDSDSEFEDEKKGKEKESKKKKKRNSDDNNPRPIKKSKIYESALMEPSDEADKKEKNKKKKKKKKKPHENSRFWTTVQNHSYQPQPSRSKALPISIPECGTGDFEVFLNEDAQVSMTFVPNEETSAEFRKKRFVVMIRSNHGPSHDGTILTGMDILYDQYVVKEAMKADSIHASNSSSRDLIVGSNTPKEMDPNTMAVQQMWRSVSITAGKEGGVITRMPAGNYSQSTLNAIYNVSLKHANPTREAHVGRFDDKTPGGFYSEDQLGSRINLPNVGNAIYNSLNQNEDANSRLQNSLFVPREVTELQGVYRAQVNTLFKEFEDMYRKNVSQTLGVPYHLIDTSTGHYKPLEEQTIGFEAVIETSRHLIRDFFTFVYNEAFHEVRNNALQLLVDRLNETSSQTISDLTIRQTQQMLDQVRSGKKSTTPQSDMDHINDVVNSIAQKEDDNSVIDLDPKQHAKLMLNFDEKGYIMLKQLSTIKKMVGLIELSKRQTETPRVIFKLPVLFSITKMKAAIDVAGEDEEMRKPIKKQFNAFMESYNSGDY